MTCDSQMRLEAQEAAIAAGVGVGDDRRDAAVALPGGHHLSAARYRVLDVNVRGVLFQQWPVPLRVLANLNEVREVERAAQLRRVDRLHQLFAAPADVAEDSLFVL